MANAWKTVYENDSHVCNAPNGVGTGFVTTLLSTDEPLFTKQTMLRLTVDDTVITENCTPTVDANGNYNYRMGNLYLIYPASYEDDGRDYAINGFYYPLGGPYVLYLYSRNAGTYSVNLSAYEPNPAPTLDPTALLMCWQVGNRIRQRGGA